MSSWFFFYHPKVKGIPLRLLIYDFYRVGVLALTVSYACLIILWYHKRPSSLILNGFRHVGMMSLTNYLLHTIAYVILLHGVGFGLMGKLTAIETLGVALVIYAVQLIVSSWWLRYFRFGPAEWIWRQLSYGRRFPIAKTTDHS